MMGDNKMARGTITESIGWERVVENFAEQRMQRCIKRNGDLVILVAGPEGHGKSLFALSLACAIDPTFSAKHIYYDWESYVAANMGVMKRRLNESDTDTLKKYNSYGVDFTQISDDTVDDTIQRGSCLLYDEAGVGAFNRQSMTEGNINQVKLFIGNRFLNLVHILCVPNPSTLDTYLRSQRVKIMAWIECMNAINEKDERISFFYGPTSYKSILVQDKWWKLFAAGGRTLYNHVAPDLRCELPDFTRPWGERTFISPEIMEEYHSRKLLFNYKMTTDMLVKPDGEDKAVIDHRDRMVRLNESKISWVRRTGLSPKEYSSYGGCKNDQKQLRKEEKEKMLGKKT